MKRVFCLLFLGYIPNADGHHPLGGRYPSYPAVVPPQSRHGHLYQQAPYLPASNYPTSGHYESHDHGYPFQVVRGHPSSTPSPLSHFQG